MIELINKPKKKDVLFFFNIFPIYIWLKQYFDMSFDNLIKFYVSHHYYIAQAI